MNIESEILVLLNSHYPATVPVAVIHASMNRRSKGSLSNALCDLWKAKLIEGSRKGWLSPDAAEVQFCA